MDDTAAEEEDDTPTQNSNAEFGVESLAAIESSFQDLRRVLVVCHMIEPPTNGLLAAVKKNFSKRVKYIFLVSHERAETERKGYFQIFSKIANEVTSGMSGSGVTVDQLVEIDRLPYNWNLPPFVFYQVAEGGQLHTYAVRGNQRNEGIAEGYAFIDPDLAEALATAIISGSPEKIRDVIQVAENEWPATDVLEAEIISEVAS